MLLWLSPTTQSLLSGSFIYAGEESGPSRRLYSYFCWCSVPRKHMTSACSMVVPLKPYCAEEPPGRHGKPQVPGPHLQIYYSVEWREIKDLHFSQSPSDVDCHLSANHTWVAWIGEQSHHDLHNKMWGFLSFFFFFFLVSLPFLGATPTVYGGSQARGLTAAVASGLCQRHSNAGSEPCLRSIPQLTATPDP